MAQRVTGAAPAMQRQCLRIWKKGLAVNYVYVLYRYIYHIYYKLMCGHTLNNIQQVSFPANGFIFGPER